MDSQGLCVSWLPVMTSLPTKRLRLLMLGGTADADRLAHAVANEPRIDAVLSSRPYRNPAPPIAWRVGGFGGIEGLSGYLRAERIDRVVDATHPFAAQMSAHAVAACAEASVPLLLALERPPWRGGTATIRIEVDTLDAAAKALGTAPRRVLLGMAGCIWKTFAAHPQHAYLVRLVDPPRTPLPLPGAEIIVARGPFDRAGTAPC